MPKRRMSCTRFLPPLLALQERPESPGITWSGLYGTRHSISRRSLFRRIAREFEAARWFESQGESLRRSGLPAVPSGDCPTEQREVIVLNEHTFEGDRVHFGLSPIRPQAAYRYGMNKLRACLRESNLLNSMNSNDPLETLLASRTPRKVSPCPPRPTVRFPDTGAGGLRIGGHGLADARSPGPR